MRQRTAKYVTLTEKEIKNLLKGRTVAQTAIYCSVVPRTVEKWIAEREFPSYIVDCLLKKRNEYPPNPEMAKEVRDLTYYGDLEEYAYIFHRRASTIKGWQETGRLPSWILLRLRQMRAVQEDQFDTPIIMNNRVQHWKILNNRLKDIT